MSQKAQALLGSMDTFAFGLPVGNYCFYRLLSPQRNDLGDSATVSERAVSVNLSQTGF